MGFLRLTCCYYHTIPVCSFTIKKSHFKRFKKDLIKFDGAICTSKHML